MLAVVRVVPSPASLNEHTSAPLPLMDALALTKCGLSACAAGTATMPLTTSVSSTISFLMLRSPLLEIPIVGAAHRPLSDVGRCDRTPSAHPTKHRYPHLLTRLRRG